jgi:hypothetical protein
MRVWLVAGMAALGAPAAAQAPRGCADHMHVVIESGSIRQAAGPPRIEEGPLEALRVAAGTQFKAAAAALCRSRKLDARRMAGLRQVVILQGAGATEPLFYEPSAEFGGEALVFQYIWAESGLKPPARAAVDKALACWAAGNCPAGD